MQHSLISHSICAHELMCQSSSESPSYGFMVTAETVADNKELYYGIHDITVPDYTTHTNSYLTSQLKIVSWINVKLSFSCTSNESYRGCIISVYCPLLVSKVTGCKF